MENLEKGCTAETVMIVWFHNCNAFLWGGHLFVVHQLHSYWLLTIVILHFYLYIDSTEKDISRLSDDDSQKLWSEIHRHNAIKGDGAVSVSFWRFAVSSFSLPPGYNYVSTWSLPGHTFLWPPSFWDCWEHLKSRPEDV